TLNELINGVMTYYNQLHIGILPVGTFNEFTKTINISTNHKQSSEQMISAQIGTNDLNKINNKYAQKFVCVGLNFQNTEKEQEGSKD
ncbi:diacylglycerol kinase family protein, partial [Staphylococcus aureus]|nr:diacylglycerol kinase family protein [Staphylococcus aureus]